MLRHNNVYATMLVVATGVVALACSDTSFKGNKAATPPPVLPTGSPTPTDLPANPEPSISANDTLNEADRIAITTADARSQQKTKINDALSKCAASPEKQTKAFSFVFPKTKGQCTDFVEHKNGRIAVRLEEGKSFEIPSGATVCSMNFTFKEQAEFYYDDQVMLLLDGSLLLSSIDPSKITTPELDGLYQYRWATFKDKPLDGINKTYCPTTEDGKAGCDLPATQTNGTIRLAVESGLVQALLARVKGQKHVFQVVTTGDNDPAIDCQHSDIEFTLNVTYLPQ